jgi:excisionase family DNA binding protein
MENTNHNPKRTGDWVSRSISPDGMLTSREVANLLGYRSRASFWAWVHREQPPHVRVSARNIRFPKQALDAWLAKRSNSGEVE